MIDQAIGGSHRSVRRSRLTLDNGHYVAIPSQQRRRSVTTGPAHESNNQTASGMACAMGKEVG